MPGGLTAEHPGRGPGGLTAAALAPDPLQARVDRHLDARLERGVGRPVALGLSGGSDSLALLHLAADWCARTRRPLLALTVDHGLSPLSAGWTARAARMAAEAGAAWRGLAWIGPKPATGLPAAARAARHALLADAAREAGASVLLLAHTADDLAEAELMRRAGGAGGAPRSWAPSPAWPEGRGVFLLRPLLESSRAELRARLAAAGRGWIDDPANDDRRYARARARALLKARTFGHPPAAAADPAAGFGEAHTHGVTLARADLDAASDLHPLRAAIACASGGSQRVRAEALRRLLDRLSGEPVFEATAGGARLVVSPERVEVGRELGRHPPGDLPLTPGEAEVWDGRFELLTAEPSWRVGIARGRAARLSPREHAQLAALPAALRPAVPVLLRGDEVRLAADGVALRPLVPTRFDAAVGRVRREADLP